LLIYKFESFNLFKALIDKINKDIVSFLLKSGLPVNSSIEEETIQVMNNLKAILNKVGFDFSNVIKSTIYLSDMDNFSKVNEVYGSFFNKDYVPSRVTVEVSRLPKDANVEIDMIAS